MFRAYRWTLSVVVCLVWVQVLLLHLERWKESQASNATGLGVPKLAMGLWHWGNVGVILGLCGDNGKENRNDNLVLGFRESVEERQA